ncbi:Crp/Fnr family transcriptional regulator [Salinimicrobium gaetbulicola]|uniref:Crp/Fnr family transcriptional regulator n=2 Tax=Salinimicrobium gaetbulicola TaxID=999702 RepID=A0ABW3ICV2_9FLAO
MKMNEKKRLKYIEALRENKLLKDLNEEKRTDILENLEEEIWPRNTCNLSITKPFSRFHFIISGRIKVYKVDPSTGREITLFILKGNDVFDIISLLEELDHEVFYETLDKATLLSTPMAVMRKWVQENPEINKNMLPYLGHQLKFMEEYASDVTMIDISTRLAKLILSNINSKSQRLELINDLSNEELANLIGSTRAVVNRHLQEFKNDGILYLGRQKVEIRNLELLLKKLNSPNVNP